MENSTVSGNIAEGQGGGIYLPYGDDGAVKLLVNCTISGNTAVEGGGLFINARDLNASRVEVFNSTVANNTAPVNGRNIGIINFAATDVLILDSTIVANSPATSGIDIVDVTSDPNAQGKVSANFSLIGNVDGGKISLTKTSSIVGDTINGYRDPQLGPLKDNGGPTQTHELLWIPGQQVSPAIDAGQNSLKLAYDQRGADNLRTVNFFEIVENKDPTDIGAYERRTKYPTVVKIEVNPDRDGERCPTSTAFA